jgi:hypothetical protein
MCLRVSYQNFGKKPHFFASLKSLKKGVGSRVGSGSGSASKCNGSPTLPPPNCIIHTEERSWIQSWIRIRIRIKM